MTVFKSGAFLQQCFSVHPLSLDLKMVAPPEMVGVFCKNCRMRHRMTVNQVMAHPHEKGEGETEKLHLLQECFRTHPDEIRVAMVHIEHHAIEFKCRPCHRTYSLDVALFETHQS